MSIQSASASASVASLVVGFETLAVSDGNTLKAPLKPTGAGPSRQAPPRPPGAGPSRKAPPRPTGAGPLSRVSYTPRATDTLGTLRNLHLGTLIPSVDPQGSIRRVSQITRALNPQRFSTLNGIPVVDTDEEAPVNSLAPLASESASQAVSASDSKPEKKERKREKGAEAEAPKTKGKSKAEKEKALQEKYVKEKIAAKAAQKALKKENAQNNLQALEKFLEVDFTQQPHQIYKILKLADYNEQTLQRHAIAIVCRNLFQALNTLRLFEVNCLQVGIVTDRLLGFVARHCKELSMLDLHSTFLTPAAVPELMKLDKLTHLSLQDCGHQVSKIGIDRFTQLEALNVANTPVDDAWLERLFPLRALRRLNISGCTEITERGVYTVLDNVKALRKLNVRYSKVDGMMFMMNFETSRMKVQRISQDTLALVVTNRKALLEVSLTLPCLEGSEVQVLRYFEEGLTHLWLTACGMRVNEISIDKFSQLERLDVSNTDVNDAWLARLANLKTLQNLNLSGCDEITERGVKEVLENCRALRNLNLQLCKNVEPDLDKALHERVAIKMSLENRDEVVSTMLRKLVYFETLQGNLLEMIKTAGPTITDLNLSGMVLSPGRLDFLKEIFKAVQTVSFENSLLETNMLPEIGRSFPKLRELNVSGLRVAQDGEEESLLLNDEHLHSLLINSQKLRSLRVDHTAVTSAGLSRINRAELIKKVTLLSLQGCSELFKDRGVPLAVPQKVSVLYIKGSGLSHEHHSMLKRSNTKLIVVRD